MASNARRSIRQLLSMFRFTINRFNGIKGAQSQVMLVNLQNLTKSTDVLFGFIRVG